MCLAIPMRVVERGEFDATVELEGVRRRISVMLVPEAAVGDWVLVHAGYAIGTVDEARARETLELLEQYSGLGGTP
ncbi:MAG: HypC/HybG/HupF family hydrogenase formation chaperone [Nitrospirae bacterium]|nr:MAG: HypC/HybG/HupF family hydrogenase formation chaperone [Nitrospirota bacterium]